MRILDRFIVGSFLRLFVVSILATPPLFVLGELTEDIDTYVDMDMSWVRVAYGYVFRLPEYIVWSFPIAGLIAAVFTVHNMTAHREIVAAKAGGISFHRLFLPIAFVGVLLTGVALALTEVAPRSNRIAFGILKNEQANREWRSDFLVQTEEGLTVAGRRLTVSRGRIDGVVVQRAGIPGMPDVHVEAEAAVHDTLGWRFQNGYLRLVPSDGALRGYQFESLFLPGFNELPEELLETPPEEEEMTYAEIGRLARIIQRSGGTPNKFLVRREQKLAIPVATLVIILFGAPLATTSKRGGTAYGIGVALGTTILYMLLFKVTGGFGAAGAMDPVMAAWIPNVLFLVAGTVLLIRVRT
ncbi:MAG TPA: LptF/LptG family permease [Longimicrobiales bacterium]